MFPKRCSAGIFLAVFLLPAGVFGQQEYGSIVGQVTDPSGAAVPGAQVLVKNQSTGASFSARTDAAGFYRAPQLTPGFFTLSAGAAGFNTVVRESVEVRVADRLRVDFALQVGAVNETVVVKEATPLLQTEDATAGQVVDNQRITELPLNGRNWLQLATLAPGTVTYPGVTSGGFNTVVMNLGGNRTNQTNYLIDGADNNTFTSSGSAVIYPPVDSLQEFKVQTSDYTADTGRLGGAVVNATIKSGSNSLHGTAYEFLRNRELNARNYFTSPAASTPEFTRNQFGASAGGPIVRNKLFFFLNYEGNRQRQDAIGTTTVFTNAQKSGDFSSLLGSQIGTDALGRPVNKGEIFDPLSLQTVGGAAVRDPFPGNIIPASHINPVSQRLINLVPAPNSPGAPNYVKDIGSPADVDQYVGRVDWVRSDKDTISGHMLYSDQESSTAPLLGLPADGGNATSNLAIQRAVQLAWTHVFRPTDLNEFRVGYLRNLARGLPAQPDQDLNAKYGIPFPFPGKDAGGLASLLISGFTSIGSESGNMFQPTNKYELSDTYTAIRGPHSLKFGFRAAHKTFYNQMNCNGCRGILSFNGAYTQQPGFGATGSPAADFLTGVVANAQTRNVANEQDVGHDYEAYAQDRWRVSSKLTVTAGLNYQYNPPNWEVHDNISSVLFSLSTPNSAQIVVPPGMSATNFNVMQNLLFPYITVRRATDLDRGLVRNTYLNFAPRLGIAWQVTPKTVARAGYGIYYGYTDVVNQVPTLNPPTRVLFNATANNINPTLFIDQSVFGANPFSAALVAPGYNAVRDPNIRPDLTQMYNLMLQHEFASNWLVEVGFMGNRSSRILMITSINDAIPALPSDLSSIQSRRRVSTLLGPIQYMSSQGFSNYNALTVNMEKRFSQDFSVLASYTWSRALGVAPALTQGINTPVVENPVDLKREYGPLEFDVMRRFVVSYLYGLPFGKDKRFFKKAPAAVNYLIDGWQLNGITTLQGGFPLTPSLSFSLGKTETNSRPNAIGDPTKTTRQPSDWISAAAFAIPSNAEIAAGNFFGNAGVGSVHAPGLVNFDFSILKNIPIREGMRLQFRAECFNLTNTPFFGVPGSVNLTFGSSSFGKVTSAGDPRIVQLGLKLVF